MTTLTMQDIALGEQEFRLISDLVYEHCGINLHDGKKELVRARLAKRLREGRFANFSDYIRHVMEDPTGREFSILVDSLSTNLTKFFREEQHFEYMRSQLLPRILAAKQSRRQLRIRGWSAGCSTGEEPYSIAITLLEALPGKGRWDVKLLATDVSTRVLEQAQRGLYDKDRIDPIPLPLRSKYLNHVRERGRDLYEVGDALRNVVIFRYLNLMQEWPIKGPLDFIFCRNVMIYFDKPTQGRLINRYYDLLGSGGVLFTGHSESLTGIDHKFRYVQPTIYTKP
ncbi:MAG TPA: protein-glutamate O-methyltransferase CheR [Sedimentisphaerales bacterium]|nr:protein-glutamate O-methyltransferase CheR [Sedimentisphaerales bacterium]HQG47912.1 protein-glutamate O-methyltransferase CheR [Sedimentisphaerales bacterium]HQI28778.1 protein-glutamate O-methyltransferase CheR [Sedimentisphaerales bacterium]